MKNRSLRRTVKVTYIILLSITLIPSIFSIVVSQIHTQRYNKIISNVSSANRINSIAKNDIPEELWNIICGKKFRQQFPYGFGGNLRGAESHAL